MIETILDIVLIVAGILWALVFLALLLVTFVVGFLLRKYLGEAHRFLDEQVRPTLFQIQDVVEALRLRTASLPQPGGGARIRHPERLSAPLKLSLPFLRRRKPWYTRLLQR